jgi:hypothetical protein
MNKKNYIKSFLTSNLSKNLCPHSPQFLTVHLSYSFLYFFKLKKVVQFAALPII